jgi:hypothetical protein
MVGDVAERIAQMLDGPRDVGYRRRQLPVSDVGHRPIGEIEEFGGGILELSNPFASREHAA